MPPSSIERVPQDIPADSYIIEREIGRGGMATVYAARDTKHGRRVALKVLRPDLAASLSAERFRREITLAAGLQHPHIVPVHDSGETPSGALWFTMPLVEGESLRDRLRRQHQLSVEEAIRITREIALALDYAHRHGVIHRDIKPENILLVDDQAMVADFGIARAVAAASGERLTATGMAVGTPRYMSPEQAAGEQAIDACTDIYSLGVLLYEMLAGEPPYTGPTAQVIAAKMMTGEVPSVRRTRPSVPQAVDAVIRKALSPVPADRFATAAAFASVLGTAERTAGAVVVGATPSPAPRGADSRSWLPVGAAALGLGVLIGAGVLFAWRHQPSGAMATAAAGPVGVAVLPFDTESDTTNAYFAEGITDEIRSKLSALGGLRLIAAASSNQYRRTAKPLDQISRELGVPYLLTGRIQWEQSANGTRRVRISPELIQITSGQAPVTKWQQSYDTTLADVFDVQSAVATRVADKLGVVLTPQAQTRLAGRPTQNLAAYDAYLRSTALEGQDPATLRRALAAAEQAVALDSGFAVAWARASIVQTRLYNASLPTRADADAAKRAAERAVALAPTAMDGYRARGVYNMVVTGDMSAGLAASQTASRLAPSSAEATGGLGSNEVAIGQWTAGLNHLRQAVALDPRSAVAAVRLTLALLYLRRYPEARAEAERGLTFAPTESYLIVDRAISFLGQGDLAAARASLRDVPPTLDRATLAVYLGRRSGFSSWAAHTSYWPLDTADRALVLTLPPVAFDNNRGEWGRARAELYWLTGDTVRAHRYADSARIALDAQVQATPEVYDLHLYRGLMLAYLGQHAAAVQDGSRGLALAQAAGDGYRMPRARYVLAQICVAAGDHPRALDQLEALLSHPDFVSPAWLKVDPTWAPLYGDPRFERLIAQPTVAWPTE